MGLVFMIPIVHADSPNVSDYAEVESTLRVTLDALSRQSDTSTKTVVICHEFPVWHHDFSDKVYFLRIGPDKRFPLRHVHRHIDQGIKLLVGALFAIETLSASHIMRVDGDDFVHVDMARRIVSGHALPDAADGWLLTRGLNALVEVAEEKIFIKSVYEVSQFNRDCGTCRIFKSEALRRTISEIAPATFEMRERLPHSNLATVDAELIDAIFEDIADSFADEFAPFRIFSNHIRQELLFQLVPLAEPLAVKSCGHRNHAGPRAGAVHWHRVRKRIDADKFFRDFGLADSAFAVSAPVAPNALETAVRPWIALCSAAIAKITFHLRKSLVR